MQYEVNFLHVCDSAFFSEDKKLNVIGVFGRVTTEGFPAANPRFSIVVNLTGDLSNVVRKLEMVSPSGGTVATIIAPAKPLGIGDQKSTNWIVNLIGIIFPEPGSYKILVKIDDTVIN